jgi:hypothetical protein
MHGAVVSHLAQPVATSQTPVLPLSELPEGVHNMRTLIVEKRVRAIARVPAGYDLAQLDKDIDAGRVDVEWAGAHVHGDPAWAVVGERSD